MAKKPSRVVSRTGLSTEPKNLKAGEYGYTTDDRAGVVGDDTNTPPKILTTKSKGSFDFSSTDLITVNDFQIEGTLNGKDISDIIDQADSAFSSDTNIFYKQLPSGTSIVVKSASIADPPVAPGAKDIYIVPDNATGSWAGKTKQLTQKIGTEWVFVTPPVRTIVGVADTGLTLIYQNSGWQSFFASNDEHIAHLVSDKSATPLGVYAMIQDYIGNGGGTEDGVKYTASITPPPNPSLKDYWWDQVSKVLNIWAFNGSTYSWLDISSGDNSGTGGSNGSAAYSNSDYVLPLTWLYGIENFSFETFTDDNRYSWRDFSSALITNAVAGDDTIDVSSTAGLQINETYALVDSTGTYIQSVDVISVLTSNRIRTRNDLGVTLGASANAKIVRTSMDVSNRFASVKDKDVFYSKFLNNINSNAKSNFVLRRSGIGLGIFSVRYRFRGSLIWQDAELAQVMNVGSDSSYRDEYYDIPAGGAVEFYVSYSSNNGSIDNIYHFALYPKSQAVDANRIVMPVNVSPADQAVSVSTTPTLVGSTYRSIYGLQQNGAEFQVATDKKMSNIVVSSSSDFLASWIRVNGATANSKALQFITNSKVVVVGDAGSVRVSTDGGKTYTASTLSGSSFDVKGVSFDGVRLMVAGAGGNIQFSDDQGTTFTAASLTDGFVGTFNGIVSLSGDVVVAVGASGQISRSTNKGVIFTKILPDNSFTNAFNSVCSDSSGNIIAVGNNGEIQTSSNRGQSFNHRSNSGNYTGTFYSVDMDDSGNAVVVGSNGEIQLSNDYGATWTHIAANNSYTGTFYGVYVSGNYVAVVGTSGEIQTSKDGGRTFLHRIAANSESGTFRAVALTPDNNALIVGDGGITQIPLKLSASTSYSVPQGSDLLQGNKVYYWRHRYQDSAGFWSDWSVPTIFATTQASLNAVKQPTNLSPASNALVGVLPTLQSSAFATTGAPDTHVKSQWQVSTDPVFGSTAFDSGETNDLLSTTLTSPLANNTKYYWRVRHKGQNTGFSPWSAATTFNAQARPDAPVISNPTANKVVSIASPFTITASDFSSPIPGDTLKSANFYVYRTLAGIGSDSTSYSVSSNTTSAQIPRLDGITPAYNIGQIYYLVVQYTGNLSGTSAASAPIPIKLRAASPIGEYVSLGLGAGASPEGAPRGVILNITVPDNVYSVCACCIAGGAGALALNLRIYNGGAYYVDNYGMRGGSGGGLTWKNDIPVTPGQVLKLRVGFGGGGGNREGTRSGNLWGLFELFNGVYTYKGAATGDITFVCGGVTGIDGVMSATPGSYIFNSDSIISVTGKGGVAYGGDGGGNGGIGTDDILYNLAASASLQPGGSPVRGGAGGGAGGYSGDGGAGASGSRSVNQSTLKGGNGAGGAAGGGSPGYPGGGVGLRGRSNNGYGGNTGQSNGPEGGGGSGGTNSNGPTYSGDQATYDRIANNPTETDNYYGSGGKWGGGAGTEQPSPYDLVRGAGRGAIRIIWGDGRSYPDNAA